MDFFVHFEARVSFVRAMLIFAISLVNCISGIFQVKKTKAMMTKTDAIASHKFTRYMYHLRLISSTNVASSAKSK